MTTTDRSNETEAFQRAIRAATSAAKKEGIDLSPAEALARFNAIGISSYKMRATSDAARNIANAITKAEKDALVIKTATACADFVVLLWTGAKDGNDAAVVRELDALAQSYFEATQRPVKSEPTKAAAKVPGEAPTGFMFGRGGRLLRKSDLIWPVEVVSESPVRIE